ncbi:MAG TPA: 50S ribosomal protein L11 methyltransferase [Longimicrobiaceae bacterium]|nr:50S ribosomal protein L11 methyltransferase [Longimicrobiaceae bacterium]
MTRSVTLSVFGTEVVLEDAPGVWMPTENGMFYSRSIRVRPGERVIDVGTGSGVLAIAAARVGARACATDTDARAVAAALRNARLNRVEIECQTAQFFGGFEGPFDVVLANLPNEIVAPAHLAGLDPVDARVFAGGEGGNEHLLALLREAPAHMHAGSRLYLPVHSLTDYHGTLRAAMDGYEVRLVDLSPLPVKPFVRENLDFYRALDDAGIAHIYRAPDGQWHSYGYVYELTLPAAIESRARAHAPSAPS